LIFPITIRLLYLESALRASTLFCHLAPPSGTLRERSRSWGTHRPPLGLGEGTPCVRVAVSPLVHLRDKDRLFGGLVSPRRQVVSTITNLHRYD